MSRLRRTPLSLSAAVAGVFGVLIATGGASAAGVAPANALTPIIRLDQVHAGMQGYGLTVFSGTKIEPFAVQVVSVVSNSSPRRSVIWIRCPGKRMQRYGPVEGMSGSPIYLWAPGEAHTLGKGGRLAGAFAFGYSLSKGCLAGVQPIQYMRQIPGRIENRKAAGADRGGSRLGLATLDRVATMIEQAGGSRREALLLGPLRRLLAGGRMPKALPEALTLATPRESDLLAGPDGDTAGVHPMMLPMNVGSTDLAREIGPLLRPYGINPVATGGGLIAGKPPRRVDATKVKLEPGSALIIPLAYGDLDLYAGGTVTDVLPNGTVLGFGHPMFGQGHEALPMATGYVNFVVARLSTSFKVLGSLKIQGSIVEDESSGIAGIAQRRYTTAPAKVTVHFQGQPVRHYHYQVVNHPGLTPAIAAVVATQSIDALQKMPMENTLHLYGSLTFTGHRRLHIDSMIPGARQLDVMAKLVPILATMMENQHQRLKLTAMNLTADVSPTIEMATLANARMNRTEVAPGKRLTITVQLQPYGQAPTYRRIDFTIPANLQEGDYPLLIAGAQTYMGQFMSDHPYLFHTETVDDIYHTLGKLLAIHDNDIYVTLQLPHQGLAVGRTELPMLPSSQAALIAAPTNTYATTFTQSLVKKIKTSMAIQGSLRFMVHVRKAQDQNVRRGSSNESGNANG